MAPRLHLRDAEVSEMPPELSRNMGSLCRPDARRPFHHREHAAVTFLASGCPYTFVIMSLLIALLGRGSITTLPPDRQYEGGCNNDKDQSSDARTSAASSEGLKILQRRLSRTSAAFSSTPQPCNAKISESENSSCQNPNALPVQPALLYRTTQIF
jgi:hypothetical protein